jgi:hypothetical protein
LKISARAPVILLHGVSELDHNVIYHTEILVDPPEARTGTIHVQRIRKVVAYNRFLVLFHLRFGHAFHHVFRRQAPF